MKVSSAKRTIRHSKGRAGVMLELTAPPPQGGVGTVDKDYPGWGGSRVPLLCHFEFLACFLLVNHGYRVFVSSLKVSVSNECPCLWKIVKTTATGLMSQTTTKIVKTGYAKSVVWGRVWAGWMCLLGSPQGGRAPEVGWRGDTQSPT